MTAIMRRLNITIATAGGIRVSEASSLTNCQPEHFNRRITTFIIMPFMRRV